MSKSVINVLLICGGPSGERGISLHSARTWVDNLSANNIEFSIIYVDTLLNFHRIDSRHLSSNTPEDFDFLLFSDPTNCILTLAEFQHLAAYVDLVIPLIHGRFGEDGSIQKLLEESKANFLCSSSRAMKEQFDKVASMKKLQAMGYYFPPVISLCRDDVDKYGKLREFFIKSGAKKFVLKPSTGGSSIGVFVVNNIKEALLKMAEIFLIDDVVLVEPYIDGVEFTILVIEGKSGPVSMLPTEIQVEDSGVFSYSRKYLPNANTRWYNPPVSFGYDIIDKIRTEAEKLFNIFEARDFLRIDGWYSAGKIMFTDINPISGMEQNSFIFEQAARFGITHNKLLHYLVSTKLPKRKLNLLKERKNNLREKIRIIMGGDNSERQVSVLSGTNVWLKLLSSEKYEPVLYLLTSKRTVWKVPYSCALHHTVEEIEDDLLAYKKIKEAVNKYISDITGRLGITGQSEEITREMTLEEWLSDTRASKEKVLIGLHGGFGENGGIQEELEKRNIPFTGSCSETSRIMMDKLVTSNKINEAGISKVFSLKKFVLEVETLKEMDVSGFNKFMRNILDSLGADMVVIKPIADGCSSGVEVIEDGKALMDYLSLNKEHKVCIIEEYIKTDLVKVASNNLLYEKVTGWIELTVGMIGDVIFEPSLTVASGSILTLEEKFQSGTGINFTPVTDNIIDVDARRYIQDKILKIKNVLGVSNYARIDIFYNVDSKEIIVIEGNSLPALTPATVLYQQAIFAGMTSGLFIERIIDEVKRY